MSVRRIPAAEAVERLRDFSAVIDARSESEYAEDHLPGAVNWPSLDDEERARIGTIYKQVSPFEARKLGAGLVTANIARHIAREVVDKPREWQPLVYCWRGGKRSGVLADLLDQIGFRVSVVDGGYKAFRTALLASLPDLTRSLRYRVVCGLTGSGKTRLLQALAAAGAQVLDLEALAAHRGSVLGLRPGDKQPTQKHFDTLVWEKLRTFDPSRPVYVESESKKVGNVAVPEALILAMRASPCIRLDLPIEQRVALLIEDYDWFVQDPEHFCSRLEALRELRGHAVVEQWQAQARAGQFAQVFRELLERHYDPGYSTSIRRNFREYGGAQVLVPRDHSAGAMAEAAAQLLAREPAAPTAAA
ncbi:tRNA 2-selenouridine(34) synthase MnmH [Ramlibacter algicola]|uniref:tRNA 2-selenouridine(34) synthase MnmH n=1 Tax=Ramlibacter algicola TaxID=2795217 RepID=A0A934Q2C8_9BURK|nr:tRNA 2-selenouridine(34) synthase MnmH [Ramlibacter algicola]MBK0393246.1 tRNA 2-selenouridine(34) synthase MnmH [Ramlibacter algicola]